ncbi:MAG: excinuclease ABC subunit B, partial [Gemmatimonadetes bacterium]|nr:excinuclease ABC subunit B [Gemmatimonadota bacterium]
EVSLVAILDADKEGFLRSERSLIQTAGRAARNVSGRVIMYADEVTGSMKRAIDETERRRKLQAEYNEEHGIVPETIVKSIEEVMLQTSVADSREAEPAAGDALAAALEDNTDRDEMIARMEKEMLEAAQKLEFELAASLRDKVLELRADAAASAAPRRPVRRKGGGRRKARR